MLLIHLSCNENGNSITTWVFDSLARYLALCQAIKTII